MNTVSSRVFTLFAATVPSIPAPVAPFGWQWPPIHPMLPPAPHPASPRPPETARLGFLSTGQGLNRLEEGVLLPELAKANELCNALRARCARNVR